MMSYLHIKFRDNWISSFTGVAMTRFCDGRKDRQTADGVTRLLDLLSPFSDAGKNLNSLHPRMLCASSLVEIVQVVLEKWILGKVYTQTTDNRCHEKLT